MKRNTHARRESRDHLIIDTGETKVGVHLFQLTDRSPHEPTERELKRHEQWGYSLPKYDHTPNDGLRLELQRTYDGRRCSFSDRKRAQLEDKLPKVMAELRHRHEAAKALRLERQRTEAERERLREIERERERIRQREAHRAEVLMQQVSDWVSAARLREYIAAMQDKAEELVDQEEKVKAEQWIAWARCHEKRLDPAEPQYHRTGRAGLRLHASRHSSTLA